MKTNSAQEIWDAALGELEMQVAKANYQTWLKDSVGMSYHKDQFVVGVPSTFTAEWLQKRLRSLIKKTLAGIIGHDLDVQFRVYTEHDGASSPLATGGTQGGASPSAYSGSSGQISPPRFNQRYTFDSFIVGSCNRLAHAAALGVAENPGHSYNPLFIYGGVGLGKTHLLQAIGQVALVNRLQLLYVSAEHFTNEFIDAIRERTTEGFRNKYRSADMLLIDDIHFISGKEQTQEGFFHTFNELHNTNRQIVITSDRHPKSISLLEERLRSRFEWGLIADIQPPDLETRIAILQAKAEQQNTAISQEVVEFIAHKVQQNIRELEGCLNRVIAYARLTKASLTPELAAQAIEDIATKKRPAITSALITEQVAKYFNLSPAALKGKRRDQETAMARQVAMYLIREEIGCSLAETGRELGGRDHSTVLYGWEKISERININSKLRSDVGEIRHRLYLKEDEAHP